MASPLLSSFYDKPQDIHFAEQEPDEIIELFLRQHWITNLPWIIFTILGLLAPNLVILFDNLLNTELLLKIPFNVQIYTLVMWYLFILAYTIESFLHWYSNIYIITNRHLVDINFHSLLFRDITSGRLDDIQSVSAKLKGIFRSLFNYGDVLIETAANTQNITFNAVPFPDKVADRIQDLQHLQELNPHHAPHPGGGTPHAN